MRQSGVRSRRTKQPKITFTLFDEQLVRCVLEFANADLGTDGEVAKIFEPIARGRREPSVASDNAASFAVFDWSIVHGKLEGWLTQIIGFDRLPKPAQQQLYDEINKHLITLDEARNLQITPAGLGLAGLADSDSVGGAVTRAMAAFLVPEGIPRTRLGKCQYRNCGKWFLRPEPKRGSVPMYCSPGHSNSEKVMAFRSRQRRAAAKAK